MEFDVSFARSINRGEGGGERKRRTDGLRAVRSVQRASSLRIAITYAVLARFFFFPLREIILTYHCRGSV